MKILSTCWKSHRDIFSYVFCTFSSYVSTFFSHSGDTFSYAYTYGGAICDRMEYKGFAAYSMLEDADVLADVRGEALVELEV
jgi:hypothetical protein